MKAHMNYSGKGHWSNFWEDKVKAKFKRVFSKSERQEEKKIIQRELLK
jgi:hypothetical protein